MKKKLKLAIACGIATMCIATIAHSEPKKSFKVGGNVELDITGDEDDVNSNFDHGGRILIDVTGMVIDDNGYFVKGVAQPLVLFNPGDQSVLIEQDTEESVIDNSSVTVDSNSLEVDDLYLQIGRTNSWDVKIGRFEAANLLPLGKDTLVVNAGEVQVYDGGNARGRVDDRLHAALNVSLGGGLLLELGVQANKDGDDENLAFRPVLSDNSGRFKWHLGLEYLEKETVDEGADLTIDTISSIVSEDTIGFAAGIGTVLFGGDLYLSAANLDGDDGVDVSTFALNYTRGAWGVGYIHSGVHDNNVDVADPTVDTFYAAYTTPLFSFKNASVTYAFSTSKADNIDDDNDSLNAVRIRFNYTF